MVDHAVMYLDKPLTVDRVLQAYEKTGLQPIAGDWFDTGCACALTAVAIADDRLPEANETDRIMWLEEQEPHGFLFGFDDRDQPAYLYDTQGATLGNQCREAVIAKFGSIKESSLH